MDCSAQTKITASGDEKTVRTQLSEPTVTLQFKRSPVGLAKSQEVYFFAKGQASYSGIMHPEYAACFLYDVEVYTV